MIVEYYSGPVCAVMVQWKRFCWMGIFENVDKGNLTSGNFWQNMGRCKIVKKNLIVTQNEEEQVSLFSLRDLD